VRMVLFIHRYLAVAVGLLMALWCLSGFVMLYQPYPALTAAERLASLAPLQLQECCRAEFLPGDEEPAGGFRIEMLNGRPVFREAGIVPIDLVSGTPLRDLLQAEVLQVAAGYAARQGKSAAPQWMEDVAIDQWSIQTARRNQPARRVALGDAAGTQLYINGRNGEIFQQTTRMERVLSWMGAIPHWLYPTFLRRNGALWSQVVIWTSVAGTFLAATGLYVGITRLQRRKRDGALVSPFRGWWYWHHIAGLVFGVLTLTWVFSGLLTMNPWGLLEGGDADARLRKQLTGEPRVSEVRQFLQGVTSLPAGEFVQLRGQPFDGKLFVMAYRADGSALRLDATGHPAPLVESAVQRAVAKLGNAVGQAELLRDGDAYYYAHKDSVELPVFRVLLADAWQTRLYISPTTGDFRTVDRDGRRGRWLERGLHGIDFPGLHGRPLWDALVLLLLAGTTAVCVTGTWMAFQRIGRDLRLLKRN
jgi:hypothetical protein